LLAAAFNRRSGLGYQVSFKSIFQPDRRQVLSQPLNVRLQGLSLCFQRLPNRRLCLGEIGSRQPVNGEAQFANGGDQLFA
jgi:hypothetical protein